MRIEPLGDSAYILRDLQRPAYLVANALNAAPSPGVLEAVASYETVGLYVDPLVFDSASFAQLAFDVATPEGRIHRIPICYELGSDLEEAAERLGVSADELASLHSSVAYRCCAVGFCPGFPYLGYVEPRISGLPRRPTPRVRVEPGSVGLTGRQTGIYPLPRPGGWSLIGRTPLTIVDEANGYFPISAGDEVTFYPVGRAEFTAREGERL